MNKEKVEHLAVNEARTHEEVYQILLKRYPGIKGLSCRSVRRFCKSHGITRRSEVDDETLDTVVHNQIELLGHCYSRRTMQGLLSSRVGIRINRTRNGQSLARSLLTLTFSGRECDTK